jgi:hypothetical protein
MLGAIPQLPTVFSVWGRDNYTSPAEYDAERPSKLAKTATLLACIQYTYPVRILTLPNEIFLTFPQFLRLDIGIMP